MIDPALLGESLTALSTLTDIRDGVLVALGIGIALILLVGLVILLLLSLRALRTLRWLRRTHDQRVAQGLSAVDERLAAWLAEGRWEPQGVRDLFRDAAAAGMERRERRKPKKRRLWGLLPPA